MSLKALKTIQPSSYELDQVQRNTLEFVNQLVNNPILGGTILKDISVSSGDNNINHNLGRNVSGWILIDIDSNISIYKSSTQPSPSRILNLTSTGTGTISLYVF